MFKSNIGQTSFNVKLLVLQITSYPLRKLFLIPRYFTQFLEKPNIFPSMLSANKNIILSSFFDSYELFQI